MNGLLLEKQSRYQRKCAFNSYTKFYTHKSILVSQWYDSNNSLHTWHVYLLLRAIADDCARTWENVEALAGLELTALDLTIAKGKA